MRLSIVRAACLAALAVVLIRPSSVRAQNVPARWTFTGAAPSEFLASIDQSVKHSGNSSAHIASRVRESSGFVALLQNFKADAYRGHRLRISVYRQTKNVVGNGAYLYVSVTGPSQDASAYANSVSRASKGTTREWVWDTVSVLIPPNATQIGFGSIVEGTGEVWLDDVDVQVVDAPMAVAFDDGGFETTKEFAGQRNADLLISSRAVSERGVDAMVAFARLTGYVRFFHPSDSVVATNWQSFQTAGLAAVESATTADSLVRTLRALFSKVAPDVQLYTTGSTPPVLELSRPADTTELGVAFWRHVGVGLPTSTTPRNQSIYSSRRMVIPLRNGVLPAEANDPNSPVRVDLGAGVSAVVPVALWMRLPRDTSMRAALPPTVSMQGMSVNNRAVRLAAVTDLWMTMQHFYPYFDISHTDWASELRAGLSRAAVDSLPSLFDITLRRMVASLHDGHGNVFRTQAATGILPVVFRWADGQVVVANVRDTTLTALRRGDIVLTIDGTPVSQLIDAQTALISSATPQWARFNAIERLGWADAGVTKRLRVRSASGPTAPTREVSVAAMPIVTNADMPTESRPAKVAELRPGVMYVDMGRISDADFTSALPKLQEATAIVFDLRGYPSFSTLTLLPRLADSVIRSARFEVPIMQLPDHERMTYRDGAWVLRPIAPRLKAAAYFLTDGRAISYAESTMGVVEAYKLGEIVGSPTAGTNGNINPFMLPGGARVVFTGMRVRKQDGSPHHGVGIQPTVRVEQTAKGIYEGRDEVLERALELIAQRAVRP